MDINAINIQKGCCNEDGYGKIKSNGGSYSVGGIADGMREKHGKRRCSPGRCGGGRSCDRGGIPQ